MQFIDEAKIHIRSGNGGAGCVSFRREKFVPRGGPDGGDGGRGGNILFSASPHLSTLSDFRYKREYKALSGVSGAHQKKAGAHGEDLHIKVPVGTVMKDAVTGELLADLTSPHQTYLALKGGRGGKGNTFFKSSVRQTPMVAQPGESGKERGVLLELKLLADVGLIGLPNAGKSTLLSRLSNAKPKIADYPFTTLHPHLGVVRLSENQDTVMADIPGLIEGAHEGKGLGIRFLKHLERTRLFLHLIDITDPDPVKSFETIRKELGAYNPLLLKKIQHVLLTKIDILPTETQELKIKEIGALFSKKGVKTLALSAVSGAGIKDLLTTITHDFSSL